MRLLVSHRESIHLTIDEAERHAGLRLISLAEQTYQVDRTIGLLQPILDTDNVEVREYIAPTYNTILRFDEQMLIGLHIHRSPPDQYPVLHLVDSPGGLFERYTNHYQALWNTATPVLRDPDLYPDPAEHPDRYQPAELRHPDQDT